MTGFTWAARRAAGRPRRCGAFLVLLSLLATMFETASLWAKTVKPGQGRALAGHPGVFFGGLRGGILLISATGPLAAFGAQVRAVGALPRSSILALSMVAGLVESSLAEGPARGHAGWGGDVATVTAA